MLRDALSALSAAELSIFGSSLTKLTSSPAGGAGLESPPVGTTVGELTSTSQADVPPHLLLGPPGFT
jgi:hypothetical protein